MHDIILQLTPSTSDLIFCHPIQSGLSSTSKSLLASTNKPRLQFHPELCSSAINYDHGGWAKLSGTGARPIVHLWQFCSQKAPSLCLDDKCSRQLAHAGPQALCGWQITQPWHVRFGPSAMQMYGRATGTEVHHGHGPLILHRQLLTQKQKPAKTCTILKDWTMEPICFI